MDDEEIKELSMSMASLGKVSSPVIERLFVEFADQLSATGSLTGSYDSTERLLMDSLDEGVGRVLKALQETGQEQNTMVWFLT